MITVRDYIKEQMKDSIYREYTPFQVEQLLISYGRKVVDECTKNVYMTNIGKDGDIELNNYQDMEGNQMYPTLNVIKVKNMIR